MTIMSKPCNIGIYNYYQIFNSQNKIFDSNSYSIGSNLGDGFIKLKKILNENNFQINTFDVSHPSLCKKIIFIDYPSGLESFVQQFYNYGIELYLILFEPEVVKPDNFILGNHTPFKKVFTYNENLIKSNPEKYVKIYNPNKVPDNIVIGNKRDKLCCMINVNHSIPDYVNELYSERIEAIKYFEDNKLEDFDLWGIGWNSLSYKGQTQDKIKTLSNYKFSFCYENVLNDFGYLSEKIFDSFFAGTIPIYLGYDKVKEMFGDCVIVPEYPVDYDKLYAQIKNMSDEEYNKRSNAIKRFILSDKITPYRSETFAETIIKGMVE